MSARTTQQFQKGQAIVIEGAQGDRTYRILSGEVVVCKRNANEELIPVAKLGVGEIFGEMYLFDGSLARSATVVASSPSVLLEVFFQDEVEHMITDVAPHLGLMLKSFARRLGQTSRNYAEMVNGQRFTKLPDGSMKPAGGTIIKRDGEG